ncbi:MAG: methyltransferase, partial [Burkholderiales bacterium]|nr:methyltransferase [Burkholderiales bacterium]
MEKWLRLAGVSLLAGSVLGGWATAAAGEVSALIEAAINGAHRSEAYKERDQYRHPKQTLLFFGLKPDMTVVEITPGGGWYTEILAPVMRDRGTYYVAAYRITETSAQFFRRMDAKLRAKLNANPSVYGKVKLVHFDRAMPKFAPAGSADLVLTFRNVHNWAKAGTAELMFQGFAAALKPGGVLGVVEHR